jgi:hypothetical protein
VDRHDVRGTEKKTVFRNSYKRIPKGCLVSIGYPNLELFNFKPPSRGVPVVLGEKFTLRETWIPHGSIGIAMGYKFRKKIKKIYGSSKIPKKILHITKWHRILIENSIYLIPDYLVNIIKDVKIKKNKKTFI